MVTVDQIKSLVAQIKEITGLKQFEISKEAGYEPKTLGQLISKGVNLEEPYEQLKRVFGQRLKNSPQTTSQGFAADQLFAMFLEVTKAQTAILQSIESKMARETTQAEILKMVIDQQNSFARSDKNQLGLASLVGELLMRDFVREAKSNPGNVQKILQDFLRRIGPKLTPDVKESIGVDGHK